jgi:hypothetical protein
MTLAVTVVAAACGSSETAPTVTQPVPPCEQPPAFSTFELGAVWTYDTRPGEESSTFTVRCIESDPEDGRIIHVEVKDVRIATGGQTAESIGHLPISEDSLTGDLVERVGLDEGPPSESFVSGYTDWRDADAGAWRIPLSEILDAVEGAVGG